MRTLTRGLMVAVLAAGVQACGSPESERSMAADTLSRAQKDSIAASLPIPGAGAVGAALRAGDAAAARAEAHDSIGG
jgi:hypothetical protein